MVAAGVSATNRMPSGPNAMGPACFRGGVPFFNPEADSSARTAGTNARAVTAARRRKRVNMAQSFRTNKGEKTWEYYLLRPNWGSKQEPGGLGKIERR